MTSHDAVLNCVRFWGQKIGHGGTLDPDVVGVLPIAVGKATRMVEFMQDEGKVYGGGNHSWIFNDDRGCKWRSGHGDPPVLSPLDETIVDEAIASLTGPITQIPTYVFGCQGQWSQAL